MKILKSATVALLINLVTVVIVIAFTRTITVDCCVCERHVFVASPVEYQMGPFKEVPALHIECAKQIQEYWAPNCGMDMTEWLAVRGYFDPNLTHLGVSTIKSR